MDSEKKKSRKSDDKRDPFFSIEDYNKYSCVHYLLTTEAGRKLLHGNTSGPPKQPKVTKAETEHKGGRLATLSKFEHELYLDLKKKYGNWKIPESPAEVQDLQVLQELELKVETERRKVNEYLHNTALTTRRQDYYSINPDAKRYITEVTKEELQFSLQHPRFYRTNKIIPLLPPGSHVKDIPLKFAKVILKLGHAAQLLLPNSQNNCFMNAKYEKLARRFPPKEIGSQSVHPSKQHISRDSIVHHLSKKYETDVVITLASLKTLMDNVFPGLEHNWEIPVIICEDKGVTGDPLKCVYVEKPIPPASLSVRAKNELCYNYIVKMKFAPSFPRPLRKARASIYAPPVVPADIKPVAVEVQAEVNQRLSNLTSFEDVFESSEKVCELDTFGISGPEKLEPPPDERTPVSDCAMDSMDSEHSSDDDDEFDVDILDLKELIVENCNLSEVENSDLSRCPPSPMSNADSDHDMLVIDCESEGKSPNFSALQAPEKTSTPFDKASHKSESMELDKCSIEQDKQNDVDSGSDSEEAVGKKKKKPREISDDDDSNMFPGPTEPAAEKSDQLPDTKIPKRRQLRHTKKGPLDEENKAAPKDNIQNRTESSPVKGPLDDILISQHKMLKPEDKIDDDTKNIVPSQFISTEPVDEIAKEFPEFQSQHENATYSLWHLGNLKIMLRSEVDCQISQTGRPTVPTFLFPKLEYQTKFGYEVTTPSELMRQWVLLHTHPGSHLLKVHVDTQRSSLALLEEFTISNLLKNKKDLNVQQATHQLFIILDTLKSLPEGQYLMTHKKGDSTVTLQKAVPEGPKSGAFDLHTSINQRLESIANCEDEDPTRKEVPWLPIDSSISPSIHEKQKRIPGCFFPTDFRKWQNAPKMPNTQNAQKKPNTQNAQKMPNTQNKQSNQNTMKKKT